MANLNSQHHYMLQHKLDIVAMQVEDVKETLMKEIHCSHCLCRSGEPISGLPCEPSGWAPQYQSNYHLSEINAEDCVREDKAEVSQRMWGFEDETEEVPIIMGSPASIISQEAGLHPVSPLDLGLGELEAVRSLVSTLATSVPDEHIIPLPVLCGVIHTSFNGRHHPYPTLPPATSKWTSAHHALTVLICYYVERPVTFPGWGTVVEQVVPMQPLLG